MAFFDSAWLSEAPESVARYVGLGRVRQPLAERWESPAPTSPSTSTRTSIKRPGPTTSVAGTALVAGCVPVSPASPAQIKSAKGYEATLRTVNRLEIGTGSNGGSAGPPSPHNRTMPRATGGSSDRRHSLTRSGSGGAGKTNVVDDAVRAVHTSNVGMLERTITSGQAATIRDRNGCTPLHLAVAVGWQTGAQLLLKHGLSITCTDTARCTPLHYAALAGNSAVAKLLLQAGTSLPADEWGGVDVADVHGCTALHHAAAYGSAKVLAVLLRAGASVEAQTKLGATPLHYAAANGHESVVRRLLRAGANPSAFDDNRSTPAHVAAFYCNTGAVRALLDAGARRDVSDLSGLCVVDAVRATHDTSLIRWLSVRSGTHSDGTHGGAETAAHDGRIDGGAADTEAAESCVDLFDFTTVVGEEQAKELAVSLCRDKKLRGLDLAGSKFGARGLIWIFEALQVNKTLRQLVVTSAVRTVAECTALSAAIRCNVTLQSLNLAGTSVGTAGMRALATGLAQNTTITVLDLSESIHGPAEAAEICKGLQENRGIEVLSLNNCRFTARVVDMMGSGSGMRSVGQVLRENLTLVTLNLAGSVLTKEDAAELASAISENYTLATLDISGHKMNDSSTQTLVTALKRNINISHLRVDAKFSARLQKARKLDEASTALSGNDPSLTSLQLDGCIESESQAMEIACAIAYNNSLRSLSLAGARLGAPASRRLLAVLSENIVMTALNLTECLHSDEEAMMLSDCLKTNRSIAALNLRGCTFGEAGIAAIVSGLRVNNIVTQLRCDPPLRALLPLVHINERMSIRGAQKTEADCADLLFQSIANLKFGWIPRILRIHPEVAGYRSPDTTELPHTLILQCPEIHEPTLVRLLRTHFEIDRRIDRIIDTKPKMAAFERALLRLASEDWRDHDGNTVLHRVLMASDVSSLRTEHAYAISARMIDINPEYAIAPNNVGITPAEIATLCPAQVRIQFVPTVLRLVAMATRKKLSSQRFTAEGTLYSVGADGFIRPKTPRSPSSVDTAGPSTGTAATPSPDARDGRVATGGVSTSSPNAAPRLAPVSAPVAAASTAAASNSVVRDAVDEAATAAVEEEVDEDEVEVEVEPIDVNGAHYLLSKSDRKVYTADGTFVGLYLDDGRVDFDAEDDSDIEGVDDGPPAVATHDTRGRTVQADTGDCTPEDLEAVVEVEVEVEEYTWMGTDYLLARESGKVYARDEENTFVGKLVLPDGSIDFAAADSSDSEEDGPP
eukprot:m.15216 g.15216  ORF g.15216 m.15216 type:complete len:1248 (-) comp8608_c0_seq1:338-4081(-)